MWVDEDGAIVGAVTIGGCVDARVIEEAEGVLDSRRSRLVEMSLGADDAAALGMTCAGTVEILIESYDPTDNADPVRRSLKSAGQEVAAGRAAVIVVPLDGSRRRLVVAQDGTATGTLGDPARDAAATVAARSRVTSGASGVAVLEATGDRVFMEVHAPPATLVVFGATHVAQPLVEMARVLGLRTVVVDGREPFATRERFPHADELLVGMPSDIAGKLPLSPRSLVVLLSHDYKYDLPVLRRVLESDAGYVGCLGSTRRGKAMLEFLEEQGVSREALGRVRVPVGLDIGATSPAEIALSVLAEALAVARGRRGGAMRDRQASGDVA